MADRTSIEWTDATPIIDRGGRRVRFYLRTTTVGPGMSERRRKAKEGLRWCRGCKQWLAAGLVRQGACQPCANAETRALYAKSESFRESRKAHRDRRRRNVERLPILAREVLLEFFDGGCAFCGAPADSFDHFEPVSKGGQTVPGNMLPACGSCNSRKRNRDPWAFLESLPTVPLITIEYLATLGCL